MNNETMAKVDADARALIGQAADYMAEHGLNKGSLSSFEDDSVCTLGALHKVHLRNVHALLDGGHAAPLRRGSVMAIQQGVMNKAIHLVYREVEKETGSKDAMVPEWNDAPERTLEDVLLMFKRAAHE